jgi:hypothetical protein
MNVTIRALTEASLVQDLALFTMHKENLGIPFTPALFKRYIYSEHSPIRCYILHILMQDIAPPVSVHFVRHKVGVEHFVTTSRPDRTGVPRDVGGLKTVDHVMILNAQSLITIARKRLCGNAEAATRETMEEIKGVLLASPDPFLAALGSILEPDCIYRGGLCHEFKCCGRCSRR